MERIGWCVVSSMIELEPVHVSQISEMACTIPNAMRTELDHDG